MQFKSSRSTSTSLSSERLRGGMYGEFGIGTKPATKTARSACASLHVWKTIECLAMTPEHLENVRLEFREAFGHYVQETAVTEKLLTSLPFPPSGDDLQRLLIQQAKERDAFSRYQQARNRYVTRALNQMSAKAAV
jgi:hypothetical protein